MLERHVSRQSGQGQVFEGEGAFGGGDFDGGGFGAAFDAEIAAGLGTVSETDAFDELDESAAVVEGRVLSGA